MSRVGRAASASLLLLNFAAAFEQAPFHPPSPPPLCSDGECDAGESCGFCLVLVPALSCPGPKDRIAWTCEFVEPGELCEGDGLCDTDEDELCDSVAQRHELVPPTAYRGVVTVHSLFEVDRFAPFA